MKWNTTTLEDFNHAATELLQVISGTYVKQGTDNACVVCLHGDLGAGKTTMTQIIAKQLGVSESLQSPTFVIKKLYTTHNSEIKNLVHADAYRLEGEENVDALRFDEDFKKSNTLMIIEWPSMIESIIPKNAVHIYIEHAGEGRIIEIK